MSLYTKCKYCFCYPCECPLVVIDPDNEFIRESDLPSLEPLPDISTVKEPLVFAPRTIPGTSFMWRTKPYRKKLRVAILYDLAYRDGHGGAVKRYLAKCVKRIQNFGAET